MTKLQALLALGQSVWYDNISRDILDSGEMQALIDSGIVGVTSNPSIFKKAIADSAHYDAAIQALRAQGKSALEIYEALALADIGRAADLFRPVYDASDGRDGYVSIEVDPTLAHDTAVTISEARRLFAALDRPNIMIKVPATPAGVIAFETLISEGINVNVTLMFSLQHYEDVAYAYIRGLQQLAANGGDMSRVASVASFFVSRIDTAVDKALAATGDDDALALQGKIAVANAKNAYGRFLDIFSSPLWLELADQGARMQRPLWASTSAKNPAYSDTLYVDTLIGAHTVNTMPPETVVAFRDHGTAALTITDDLEEAEDMVAYLDELSIDFNAITQKLQDDGVQAFSDAFHALLQAISAKL
ncbi:MAG: transaldolase [Anaerolinea sp.]|nr:transaldolase [Anaerolinea sp.]